MSSPNHETLLARLVAFDTTSAKSNRACIDFMRDYLDGFKIRSEILTAEGGSKACLWATIGPEQGNGIVLAGHSDTVPVDGQDWTSDPFRLAERDGKLYARGSADMKGFIACALDAAGEFAKQPLKRPIHLAFTYNEETDMAGAQQLTAHMRERNIRPEWVWIGEPTGLRIIDSHKGVALFTTTIEGVSGHSGQPDKGLNAIELGTQFMSIVLRAAAEKKAKPFPGSRFDPPYTTFNLGIVKGGTAENIIAGQFEIQWQARAHPGDSLEAVLAGIEDQAAREIKPRFAAFAPRAGMKTCTCFDIPPLMPSKDNPGEKILTRLTGHNQTEAVSFATEAGFFQKLGTHAIICGPGHIEQAHQPDEYIESSQMAAGAALLCRVISESAL
ncbi:MAG: acetylornithine deacetylase [Bdellovibrionales bacterium]